MEGDKHAALAKHFYQIDRKKSEEEAKKALTSTIKFTRKIRQTRSIIIKWGSFL